MEAVRLGRVARKGDVPVLPVYAAGAAHRPGVVGVSAAESGLGVGVPCQRCDPWTPDKLYELRGHVAENVLRRLLAYIKVCGAPERRLAEAVSAIQRAGSVDAFVQHAVGARRSPWKMGASGVIGLELALGESAETRMLELGARSLEFLWKQEEELARIIDEELTPRQLLEAHLRRLPVGLLPGAWRGAVGVQRA